MAMLKNKRITFSLILVCLIAASPMANGLLDLLKGLPLVGGLLVGLGSSPGGLVGALPLGAPPSTSASLTGGGGDLLGEGLLNVANIQGVLFCTINGALNTTSAPAFSNASVELQCGKENTVVSNSITNTAGLFSIPTNDVNMLLSTLITDCGLVITTPLSTCNVNLPSAGKLVSQLTVIGSTLSGLLNIIDIVPSGFALI